MISTIRIGSSILEVVVATALISMGIIAALSLTNYSQKQSNYSKYFNEATTYNSQAADWLRSQKSQLGWPIFVNSLDLDTATSTLSYCLPSLPSDSAQFIALSSSTCNSTDYIPLTSFRRQIDLDISDVALGIITATLTTKWEEKVTRTATLNLEIGRW